MKLTLSLIIVTALVIALAGIACEGPAGPQGEQGLQGTQGAQGEQGSQGEQGPEGAPGQDGNANVQTFEFTVESGDWGNNLHYGSNNIFREFLIPDELTGGIETSAFFNEGGAIVIYANAHHDGGGSLGGWHLLPYLYRSADGIGVKLVFLVGRGSVAITRTTSGWDHISIAEENLPDAVDYRMIFIENTSFNKMADAGIDTGNMDSVMEFFGIRD